MKKMILRTTILSIAAGLVLSSCIRDNVDDRYAFGGDPEGSNTVTFVVNVPTSGSALDGIESKTRAGGIEQGGNGHTADGSVPEGYRNYQQDADVQTYGTDFGGYADADAETAAFETAVKAMAANYAKSPKKSVEKSTAAQSGYTSPATRAITEQGTYDNEIREITILRFEQTGSNKYVDYIAVPASEITSAGNVSLKKFTLTLRKGNYKVLMLANSRETIDQFIADAPDIANTTLADFEDGLKIACPGKWNSNPETDAANWKPFPMSSKAFELAIPNTRNFAQQPVELTRALAKINIIAHFDGMESMTVDNAGLKMFGALLVNRNSEGTLVPAAGWGGGTSLFDNSVVREIPSRVDPVPMLDAVDAIFEAGNTTPLLNIPEFYNSSVNRIVDQIYTFERSAPADRSEATSLILVAGSRNSISAGVWRWGGYRFFRVDLLKDNGSGVKEPVNIVRNFRYDVNITKVTSIGYTTPQEAYDHPGGVETEITAWDEEGVNEVIYNGEYQLAVDKSVIVVPYGGEAKMRVYTDYEKGWALSGTHIGSNLHYDRSTNIVSGGSIAGYSGELSPYYTTAANGSSATEVTFKMTSTVPTNGWGGAKTWNCVVSAGELHKKVTVVWLPSAQQAITNVGNGSDMPANVRPYAGAFWKSQQYGERLIRIARPTTGTVTEIDGKWSAYVLDGADWVALDTKPSTNDGLLGNDPGFDRAHKVDGSTQWAMGEMSADNPEIYFRIGLKSTYIPEPDAPARYAVVYLLMRGDPDFVADSPADGSGSSYVLYLRQGEDPDYLMRPTDAGGVLTSRPEAMKFSPYNLTADQLNAPVRATMSATANTDAGADNPGRFTDYPTQAGAFFQWAQEKTSPVVRYAWDPFSPTHTDMTGLSVYPYWTGGTDPTYIYNETCPEGYRRVTNGVTSVNASSSSAISEIRQSLLSDVMSSGDNISAGYYADGFFDRMALASTSCNSVSVNNRDVAHVGWVHYNPITNASLFFPSAGYYDYGSGKALEGAGTIGYYLSSSSYSANQFFGLYSTLNSGNSNGDVSMYSGGGKLKSTAVSIRCVQKPVSATSLAVSPLSRTFVWNAKTTGASQDFTVTADGPWTATVTAGSVADFTFTPGTGASISGTGASTVISGTGNGTFTIAPASDNGTATRTFTMTVTATDAPTTGATAPKTITVSQPFIMGVRNIGTAPGVIGYIHHPGYPDHHTLTMNKDNDGDDTNGIVYVAYFKFGSLVATSSENHGTFTSNDIVAWPNEWKSTTDNRVALNAEVTGSGAPAWAKVPTIASSDGMVQGQEIGTVPRATATNGLGDPCQYWDAEYFGGKGWRLPTAKENVAFVGRAADISSFNNQPNATSFVTSLFPGVWTAGPVPFMGTPGLSNFPVENGAGRTAFSESIPAAGCRFTSGVVGIQGLNGLYWSSTASRNNMYGWSMESTDTTVRSASYYEYAYGFAVRCVEPPIQFQQSSASFTYAGWRIDDSNYEIPIDTEATNWTVEVVDPEDDWVRIAENNIESRYVKFDFDQYGDSQWGSIDGNYYREAQVVLRAGSRTSDPFTIRQYAALYLDLIMFGSNGGLVMNADGTVAEPMQIGTNALAGVFILSQPDWLDVYWDGSALSFSATENTGGARSGTIEIYAHFPDFSLDENYKTYKTLPPIPVTQSGI